MLLNWFFKLLPKSTGFHFSFLHVKIVEPLDHESGMWSNEELGKNRNTDAVQCLGQSTREAQSWGDNYWNLWWSPELLLMWMVRLPGHDTAILNGGVTSAVVVLIGLLPHLPLTLVQLKMHSHSRWQPENFSTSWVFVPSEEFVSHQGKVYSRKCIESLRMEYKKWCISAIYQMCSWRAGEEEAVSGRFLQSSCEALLLLFHLFMLLGEIYLQEISAALKQ